MTVKEFLKWANGRSIDYDSVCGVQCVDLIKSYLDKCYGIKPGAWGDAHDYYDNFNNLSALKLKFDRIPNRPETVPKSGWIAVWGKSLNGNWGHIAVCDGIGDRNYFYSYDQNWTGHNDKTTRIWHNDNHVIGFLVPKSNIQAEISPPMLDKSGFKKGDKSLGVYALKILLMSSGAKLDDNQIFGVGTEKAVNSYLKKWGYKQNGIAGEKFLKMFKK